MYASLNGAAVLGGIIEMPRVGAWRADLRVEGASPPTSPLTLKLGDTVVLVGAVFRSGGYAGTSYVRMVGGAGGLQKPCAPRHYLAGPARVPISQTITEAGEKLSSTADSTTLGKTLEVWTRAGLTAGGALDELASTLGAAWRVLDDGSIWFGVETWPDAGITPDSYTRTDLDPAEGVVEVAMEAPTLRPGFAFLGGKIGRVRHELGPGGIRTQAWAE